MNTLNTLQTWAGAGEDSNLGGNCRAVIWGIPRLTQVKSPTQKIEIGDNFIRARRDILILRPHNEAKRKPEYQGNQEVVI